MSKKDIQDTNQADQTTPDTTATTPEDTQEPVVEKVEKVMTFNSNRKEAWDIFNYLFIENVL